MDKKMISIASLIFAVAFIGVFLFVWSTSQQIIRGEAEQLNEMYSTEVPMDLSLFENKVVTLSTIKNLAEDMEKAGYTGSTKLYFYTATKDEDIQDYEKVDAGSLHGKHYRVFIHTGVNGSVDGLALQEV